MQLMNIRVIARLLTWSESVWYAWWHAQCTCFSGHNCCNSGCLQKAGLDRKREVHVVHAPGCTLHVCVAEQIPQNHLKQEGAG